MRAFITGANGAIGAAIKQEFLAKGYEVTAPGSKELDLSEMENIAQYFSIVKPEFDVIIHCAGYNNPLPIEEISIEEFQKTQNINLNAFIEITKACLPYLKKQKSGYILGIASLYAAISRENRLSYSVSKHGMLGFMRTLALELGEFNILCNTLSPGFVDTPMSRKNNSPEKLQKLANKVPLKRLAQPENIAKTAYYLCSKENQYLTGQDITVDGGFMAGGFQND